MNPAPDNEEDLFAAALGLPRVERTAFLERACAGEPNLRGRVEALLAASEAAGDFLQEPDAEARLADDRPGNQLREENVGDRIGRYKLLQKIGEGGFGTVWMAEQEEPVRRRVALKVLKAGLDTKEVVARFESERQALALMDHPNIARVFDGGATASGRPFFVMELVRGVPITTYCDEHRLPADERLRLFIAVCQAVQHAHQKGVIHRDLKPSNILVTLHDDASVPKVIDFGIAKAIEGRLTDKTLVTQFHAFIGTPVYSSPEQVEMSALDVDTRSDIYSLGVLLYELLTGRPPFDPETLTKAGLESMRRTIREVDPPRPSTRLGTLSDEDRTSVARQRGTDPRALSTLLRGDIDWIVMRCLEKNRARRYETANGLALDIQRHLDHEPVMARSPTTGYRLRKLMRRNKLAFVSGGAIAAALLLGSIVSTSQAVRATQARRSEAAARAVAQAQEFAVRQRAYASDMNLAMQALRVNDLGRVQDLLDRARPKPGERDLRGWEWRYLWQQSRSDALATLCQKSEICSLAASADGRWLAIGAVHRDGLFIWDLETGTEVEHLAPGTAMVRAAFSTVEPVVAYASTLFLPDGSGNRKTTLRLWNAATRKTTAEILLDDPCNGLAFGQDGKRLLTSTGSILTGRSALTLWTLPEGTRVACFPQTNHAEASMTPFAVTADLRLAAHSPDFGQIGVLDLATGRAMWTVTVAFPGENLSAAAFSPDGETLATASGYHDIDIHLWDVSSGVETGRLEGHGNWIAALVFLPDGRKLVSASADQTLRTWDVASRECLDVMRGHRAEVWRLALLPDGRTLASGSKDGVVSLWDVSVNHPRRERITWPEPVADWRFSGDGGSIITASPEGTVARWSGPEYAEKEILLETGEALLEVWAIRLDATFSADGRLFAKRSSDEGIQVWDLSRRAHLGRLDTGGASELPVGFLDDGSRLLTYSAADYRMREWSLANSRELQSWRVPEDAQARAVSPDEQLVVTVGVFGDVIMRDLSGRTTTRPALDILEAADAAFSPDGRLFAAASWLAFVRVWDTDTWSERATLPGFRLGSHSVAFSPDGTRLAANGGAADENLRLWDVESWQEVLTIHGLQAGHRPTVFSPGGDAIGSLNYDGILSVWQAPTWEEIEAEEEAEGVRRQERE